MSIFTVFLKYRNFISKIRRSKITDYTALSYVFGNKYVRYSWKVHGKVNYLIKAGAFSLVGNDLRLSENSRQLIFYINAVVLIVII